MSKDTKHLDSATNCEEKNCSPTLFDLAPVSKKPVELTFTGEKISTDGGLLLLRELENQIGILDAIGNCIADERHQGYVKHSVKSLLTQRVFQIAAGYQDANDCDTLRDDKILKLCTNTFPDTGHDLSSQPTMSRFENSMSPRQLYNIALAFINHYIKSYDEPPKVIIRLFMHSAAYVLLHTFRSEMLKFSTNSLSSTFPRTIYSWGQSGMVRAYVQLTWSMNPLI